MKIDKPQPNVQPKDESTISSTALTLNQLKKATEKKEADVEAVKVRCRVCFKETAPVPRCFGHGGGGGGGGDGGGSDSGSPDGALEDDDKSLASADADETDDVIAGLDSIGHIEESGFEPDEKSFDPDVIAELMAAGLLVIKNDRNLMTLTIDLHCDPQSLTKEQRDELKKFMDAIVNEFHAFKDQHHLADSCITISHDDEGNITSIHISLPTLSLYDAFINHLAHHLIPTGNLNLQTKNEHEETKSFSPPMETTLTNNSSDMASHNTDNEEQTRALFNPSPFSIRRFS